MPISLTRKIFAVLHVGLAMTACLRAQYVINNIEKWGESQTAMGTTESTRPFISPFGDSGTSRVSGQTYGQTFRTPSGSDQILSFTFQLRSRGDGDVKFEAYLALWDDNEKKLAVIETAPSTGPGVDPTLKPVLLYQSGPEVLASSIPTTDQNGGIVIPAAFQQFTFSFAPIVLDPTKTYVAFLTTEGPDVQPSFGSADLGSPNYNFSNAPVNSVGYTGGSFVYFGNNSFDLLYKSIWEGIENTPHRDTAFVAEFSRSAALVAVPEPSTYGLMAAGALGGMIFLRRFRAQSKR